MEQHALEKVAALITRPGRSGPELLVFHHEKSGIQLPAGTVEDGEHLEHAVLREVYEETGLVALHIVRKLPYVLPQDLSSPHRMILLQSTTLLSEPSMDATPTPFVLKRGCWLRVIEQREGWSQVADETFDLEVEPPLLLTQHIGWLPGNLLATRLVRHFFHLTPDEPVPDRWEQIAEEERHRFVLFWVPLVPRPRLVAGQDEWLEAVCHEIMQLLAHNGSNLSRNLPGSGTMGSIR